MGGVLTNSSDPASSAKCICIHHQQSTGMGKQHKEKKHKKGTGATEDASSSGRKAKKITAAEEDGLLKSLDRLQLVETNEVNAAQTVNVKLT